MTCTSWPIWDQGLAHCSGPEHPLGVQTTSALGSLSCGGSQLAPSGNKDFSCCSLHGATVIASFPLPLPLSLSPEVLKVLYTLFNKKKYDTEQLVKHCTFSVKKEKIKMNF